MMMSIVIPFDGVTEADLHLLNAFEDDDGIIFDEIRMDSRTIDATKPLRYPWATIDR